jgi:multisubunit Na+/H+ antiporter MnhB subunit
MFGLGLPEIAIVLGLGYFAFRHLIVRRWPGIRRAVDFVFYGTVALMLAFALLARIH